MQCEKTKFWPNCTYDENGKLHSYQDKPAVTNCYNNLLWYKHGEIHRDNDLPAIVRNNGTKKWLVNNCFHRTTGPAIIHSDGKKEYWIHGVKYSKFLFQIYKTIYMLKN